MHRARGGSRPPRTCGPSARSRAGKPTPEHHLGWIVKHAHVGGRVAVVDHEAGQSAECPFGPGPTLRAASSARAPWLTVPCAAWALCLASLVPAVAAPAVPAPSAFQVPPTSATRVGVGHPRATSAWLHLILDGSSSDDP